jgi:hypothetical protein
MTRRDEVVRVARELLEGMALAGYRRQLRAEAIALDDLFLLLCYMDMLGLPNPAAFCLFDVYPYVLDEFHRWHRRVGMPRSPLTDIGCC